LAKRAGEINWATPHGVASPFPTTLRGFISPLPPAVILWVVGRPWIMQSRHIDLKAIAQLISRVVADVLVPLPPRDILIQIEPQRTTAVAL